MSLAFDAMTEPLAPTSAKALEETLRNRAPGQRGELLARVGGLLFARAPESYFRRFTEDELAGAVEFAFNTLEKNRGDGFSVRVVDPPWTAAKDRSSTAILLTGPDQPFLVDTLRELIRVHGHVVRELFHPILCVWRTANGDIETVDAAAECAEGSSSQLISLSFVELETRLDEATRALLEEDATLAFQQVQEVTRDFRPMLACLEESIGHLSACALSPPEGTTEARLAESVEFLRWLRRSNFVFLGFREYEVRDEGDTSVVAVARGSGLGILRDEERSRLWEPKPVEDLSPDSRKRLLGPRPLTVYKTQYESRVLRRTRMDYVGVKHYARDGRVRGEYRFLGLFTARALEDLPSDIPILRRKLQDILDACGVIEGSHDHKEIFGIFSSLPKAELFVNDVPALKDKILSVIDNRDRLDVRVSYRADEFECGLSAMVLLPRDRFSVRNRHAIQELLAERFGGSLVDYRLALTDEPQARLHFYFATPPGELPTPSVAELEEAVTALTRTWDERVLEALRMQTDAAAAERLGDRYADAFPASYCAQESAETAARDLFEIERARQTAQPVISVQPGRTSRRPDVTQVKIIRHAAQFQLSELMPILTHLGLQVWDELTYRIGKPGGEDHAYIHSFRVLGPGERAIVAGAPSRRLEDAISHTLDRHVVNDHVNSLVVRSTLDWRQVDVLRAYTSYMRQLEGSLRQRTAYRALTQHPAAAEALVAMFEAKFDPAHEAARRVELMESARSRLHAALEDVPGLNEDRVLRGFEDLIDATVRTNWYQRSPEGEHRPALALKIRCEDVRRMPLPRPLFEIFVASPAVEGIHLRSGRVARGGIRHSDRPDDYRTEVLGLMKAQRTKNALIVPVGAKGGFVLKRTPPRDELPVAVREQYAVFIRSLLDVTDNVVAGETVRPPDCVTHDEPDPYLVVAADKGTAQFSDFANEIASSREFWLGDAFASGGSSGYNHKVYGITARGAWECIHRHFLELGLDTQEDEFTVAGIGDMSGDVFGNGMLLSKRIRLVAAFNHRHIFLDPEPDAALSFEERQRLFRLPRSQWSDYEETKISAGGGIWERGAKSIRLSPEARRLLGMTEVEVNGEELIRAVLRLPVDLLFNGGIGTYVKGSSETDLDVGDPPNDGVRITAAELRARVVGEGGNLGLTQAARVELARKGGLVNTDFIDNSGGVDLSDHEVNLKILLEQAIRGADLERKERDELLLSVAEEVCDQVLANNRAQSAALSYESMDGAARLEPLRLVIDELESRGLLNRTVEGVPDAIELARLNESGMGLTRAQLAVLLAYVKIDGFARTLDAGLARHARLEKHLAGYFPRPVTERFGDRLPTHRLRDEIVLTVAVNACVNRMGLSFLHGLSRDCALPMDRVLHAWTVASELVDGDALHARLDELYRSREIEPAGVYRIVRRHAADTEELTRWLLRKTASIEQLDELASEERASAEPGEESTVENSSDELTARPGDVPLGDSLPADVRGALARSRGALRRWIAFELGRATNRSPTEVDAALELAAERLLIDRIEEEAGRIVRQSASDWQMCTALIDRLRDLHVRFAQLILARRRVSEGGAVDLRGTAEERVPDSNPIRRRLAADLDTLSSREPSPPSGLFVFVDELRKLVLK